ncbi:cysteine desulfurase family protein [Clostridium pascui]|uniref:aminotransferase class V-fold PLP-dependent enzyme n=1 Tax=Clostridium pascui TaxID=46609 RepID=UPI00195DE282|nr:aminotransferase class V-fold PLP-dependent enzyme [Clostridium pascui]MBM7870074.1 cysteine desulfurase family protein [Clostridium pascui]
MSIYIDNAATSFPKPEEVYNETLNCMKNYAANPGRSTHTMALESSTKVSETREVLSDFFNITSSFNMIFTSNATEGLNIGIKGVLKPGDHVISTVIEHNSVLRPLNSLSKKGVKVTLLAVDNYGKLNINSLKKEIQKNTKLIVVNHASNVLGTLQYINTIGKIARDAGILFMVDASQSAGTINIDVEKYNIDLLAFPGHKGLMGPQGTGGLFIRDGISIANFKEGGTGSNSMSMTQPDFLPDKFESGTLNVPGIAGLCEGVKFIQKIGRRNIQKHEEGLIQYLLQEFKKMPYVKIYGSGCTEKRSAVISINIDNMDSSEVGYLLNKKGIAVRTGYHCAALIHPIIGTSKTGTVRLSPGYFNTYEEMEQVVKVIQGIYKGNV